MPRKGSIEETFLNMTEEISVVINKKALTK